MWNLGQAGQTVKKAEMMHLNFLRSMLKLSKNTSTAIVLAEFGRLPLLFSWSKQVLLYLDRPVKLSEDADDQDRLLVHAFQSRILLSMHGQIVQLLWEDPEVAGDQVNVSATHASKLLSHEKGLQLRQIGEGSSTIIETYRNLKAGYKGEQYFSNIKSQRLTALLFRFRCGQHGFQMQAGRQASLYVPFCDRKCGCCTTNEVEDDEHVLFSCPVYGVIREDDSHFFWQLAKISFRVFLNYNMQVTCFIVEHLRKTLEQAVEMHRPVTNRTHGCSGQVIQ